MTYSHTNQANPRDMKHLPRNIWAPYAGASIMVYWRRDRGTCFEFALQLIDRALLDDGDPGIIVWTTVGPDHPRQPFSLRGEVSPAEILSGRFEWRWSVEGAAQLWLVDANYPDGYTAEAQIA